MNTGEKIIKESAWLYQLFFVALGVRKREKIMKTIFQEIENDMNEFFAEIDAVLGRDPDEVDVITDHLDEPITDEEAEHLEMKAELALGI